MKKFIGYDLEVANWIPDDIDMQPQEYLQQGNNMPITCAAINFRSGDSGYIVTKDWYDTPHISKQDLKRKVRDMMAMKDEFKMVTVNGAAFDYYVLANESGMWEEVKELCLNHVDLLLIVMYHKHHRLGLDAMAKGQGIKGKLKSVTLKDGSILDDMSGALAPELWGKGETDAVLKYLHDDCRSTLQVAEKISESGYLQWISRSGRLNRIRLIQPLENYTVRWCLENYVPSKPNWMDSYTSIQDHCGEWLQ